MRGSGDSLSQRLSAGRPRGGELARLLSLARPHAWLILLALILTAGTTAVSLAIPWVLARLVDGVLAGDGMPWTVGGLGTRVPVDLDGWLGLRDATPSERLNRLAGALLLLAVARAAMTSGQALAIAVAGERAVRTLRQRLYAHLLQLGPAFHDGQRVGALISRLIADVAQVQAAVTSDLAAFGASALTLAGSLGLLFYQSWRLSLLTVAMVPPVVLVGRLYGRAMRRYGSQYQDRVADAAAIAEETLAGIRVVQSFTQEPREGERFGRSLGRLYDTAVRRARGAAAYGAVVAALSYGALAVTVWFGGREVIAGRLSTGDLVAFVAYAGMVASTAGNLVGLYGRWANALGSSRRVFALLDEQPEIRDRAGAIRLGRVEGRLTLCGVEFRYCDQPLVLAGIDLDVSPGERIALVGPSGAGKSTLLHLVARFYDPTAGALLLDGTDLREVTLASLRSKLAIVAQEPVLFDASVAENLRYGRPAARHEELVAAARAACADEFIERLPQGYDTVVGERGCRLSGGERQRLAIARALLRDPVLLLLDEATSSLDNESERLVQEALERLAAGRTTIVIAHRLSTVHDADRIAVIDRGRVVELGPHRALLAQGGLYARLYRLHLRSGEGEPI